MKPITLFEDDNNHYLLPLSYFKHFSDLKVGCFSIKEKWEKKGFIVSTTGRNYLCENTAINNSLWVSARVIPNLDILKKIEDLKPNSYLTYNQFIIAISSDNEVTLDGEGFISTGSIENLTKIELNSVNILEYPWDIMSKNHDELITDFNEFSFEDIDFPHVHQLGKENICIHPSVQIQPGVVISAEKYPVVIDKDVKIGANSYLEGPLYIGEKTEIRQFTSVKDSSIHFNCRIGGEISGSVMLEFSNKVHHGFLGNSVLGSWTNLGAGATTSNLKNNYSNISMNYYGKTIQLDTQFMGLIFGDHSKAAINSTFNTATMVGVNTNIFGDEVPPKSVGSFEWGGQDASKKYELNKAKEVAKAVMGRRNVNFDEKQAKLFDDVHKSS